MNSQTTTANDVTKRAPITYSAMAIDPEGGWVWKKIAAEICLTGDGKIYIQDVNAPQYADPVFGPAECLEALAAEIDGTAAEIDIKFRDFPSWALLAGINDLDDLFGLLRMDVLGDREMTGLPTFGGEAPASGTDGVWSWDETRLIVGSCSDDFEIVSRGAWA